MSQFSLTLKPAQIEIILLPNSLYVQAYEITNNSSETLLLSCSVSSWIPADNLGTVTYPNTSESPLNFSLSNSDLKLSQEFLLNPGQKKQLVLKITNPTSTDTDHYSTFFITQKPLNSVLGEHQNLAKIGSHILVSTTNQSVFSSNLQVHQFTLKPIIKDIFTPIKINGEIINKGEHYSQINGQITVYKGGQLYWQQNLFPYTVTAQNSRLLQCLNSQNEASTCQLKVPLWPGTYQGVINLVGNSSKYEYSFQFFVFPYSIIISIMFLFSLLFFLLRNKQSVSSNKQ
ncbi:MAG: hypothetical protein US85_C0015G0024 [Candidatus Shapirobacteria bacterium GW2011_GWF1_38_23]|nr:MAG: hypothetical protein US46_C0004G0009 [Candidatus Shapirobacteria bacterium GW2011_GWF2_37_20]KKQ63642.1 MAG: hypothetical protein US85_C0015G0024 [Candidatus Shapirobacteria bacterium GW2011_GWF1_38_23]